MSDKLLNELKGLHTGAIDARNGYLEALRDAEGQGLSALFRRMIVLHGDNASELASLLTTLGATPDDNGSFMSTVHRTIMDLRSLFGGLGKSVLSGLIDGEERNVSAYSRTLTEPDLPSAAATVLTVQRDRLQSAITQMKQAQAE